MKCCILFLVPWVASAAIMPSDRDGFWRGNVGLPGGIPSSSSMTVYTNFYSTNTLGEINGGIVNCPSNQVVSLAAGTYSLAGSIIGKSGVVLRGTGTNTILDFSSGGVHIRGAAGAMYNSQINSNGTTIVNWTDGYAQGSSNLTLSSTSGLAVGMVITLDQLQDSVFVNKVGETDTWAQQGRPEDRRLQQWVEVQEVTNGTNIVVWPPICAPYWSGSLSPQAFWLSASSWISRFGVEDLTVDTTHSGGIACQITFAIPFELAKYCWVKNVNTIVAPNSHMGSYGAFRCEVRHCYCYGSQSSTTTSYGFCPGYCSGLLFEDNILEHMASPIIPIPGSSQCVFAYNYTTNNYYAASVNWSIGSYQSHGAHNYMMLMEGNYLHGYIALDFIHGSGSHFVAFRNRNRGWQPWTYPGGESAVNNLCYLIQVTNRASVSVGNILGTTGKQSTYASYPGNGSYTDNNVIYKVGHINHASDPRTIGWLDDTNDWDNFFRHLDYDVVTDAIFYNSTNADVTLPNSLYLSSKPSFFGAMPWPPYNPTNHPAWMMGTNDTSYTNIPAGYRALYGVDPPADGGGSAASTTRIGTGVRLGTGVVWR